MQTLQIDGLGCDDFALALYDGLRPDPDHTVTTWAEANVILSSASAAEPGPYRVSRTPYARKIQDSLSPHYPVNRVVFIKGTQIGGTQIGLNAIGFYIAHSPCPIMFIQKTVDAVKRVSKQRIAPMIAESAALREKVADARSRDSGNTMLQKDFPGGTLIMTGANSAVGLRSMPARFLFPDEVDSYEAEAEDEGDPIKLAERRTQTFGHRRKIFLVSTPTTKGRSRIESEYLASDQQMYHVPCPHCGEHQVLKFDNLKWTWGDPASVHYICEHNGCVIQESSKEWMLEEKCEARPDGAEWIPAFPERAVAGFHLNSLYSPPGWMSWTEIAAEFEEAQADIKIGKHEKMKTFRNTILAETWEDRGDAPDWQRLYDRREDWPTGEVPAGAMVLATGVDVQGDRIEASVWGWGEGFESWLIEHRVFLGAVNTLKAWTELAEFINQRTWRHESGHLLRIEAALVDSGAYTTEVYNWVRTQDPAVVFASKGMQDGKNVSWRGADMDDSSSGRKFGGRKVMNVATSSVKTEFYRQLRLERPTEESGAPYPFGYVHLSKAIGEDGCRQLVSEVRDPKTGKWSVKQGERNEWLDCRVYARAAAYWVGVDYMSADDWQRLREQYAGPTPEQRAKQPEKHRRSEPAQKSGWMGGRQKNWMS